MCGAWIWASIDNSSSFGGEGPGLTVGAWTIFRPNSILLIGKKGKKQKTFRHSSDGIKSPSSTNRKQLSNCSVFWAFSLWASELQCWNPLRNEQPRNWTMDPIFLCAFWVDILIINGDFLQKMISATNDVFLDSSVHNCRFCENVYRAIEDDSIGCKWRLCRLLYTKYDFSETVNGAREDDNISYKWHPCRLFCQPFKFQWECKLKCPYIVLAVIDYSPVCCVVGVLLL